MFFKENTAVFPGLFMALVLAISSGCATYYQKNLKFQEAVVNGNLAKANKLLDKNSRAAENRNRLLYFMQKGVLLQMMGEYAQSNQFLEQAYYFIEDHKKNYGMEILTLISNPSIKPYAGEDHEKVLIHYYKALNFLKLGQPSKALVEARRLNIRLNLLNDRYGDKKNRYSDDAFAHILMGIAYEMDHDVNNAFIAYRNAYESYKNIYSSEFGVSVPGQLKEDLLRTAYLNGFRQELEHYEKEFGVDYVYQRKSEQELIFFWHNGLGPVKDEWSLNFTIVKGEGGVATFVNEEMGLNFSFPIPQNDEATGGFGDLKFIRIAFPKYRERKPYFQAANLQTDEQTYELELAENINNIAFSILEDRMLRELANSMMRLAAKQAAEYAMRQENEDMGAVVSVINALSEKADTRNWQTLPYSISYARVPLDVGQNTLTLKTKAADQGNAASETFTFDVEEGETVFHIYHSL